MNAYLEEINQYLIGAAVPTLLMLTGLYFLFYLRAFHLRHPLLLLKTMLKPQKRDTDNAGISPFRAVTLALAGTLGVGNLVGVAGAIALGGPGAIFWMLFSAFLSMLLKYAEIVLSLRHRFTDQKGHYRGGAMYYIRSGFQKLGLPRVGAILAATFAVLCIVDSVTMGCVIQMNAVGSAFSGVFGIPTVWLGILLSVLVLGIVLSGGRRISALTERLVPFMTLLYLVLSVAVLVLKRNELPNAVLAVFRDAFRFESAASGVIAFLLSRAVRYGTMRGLLSNEAGCGTAPIAHAESNASNPGEQGIWGIFEVFADTILLCTLTAAVILVSYDRVAVYGEDGMMMTIKAYSSVLGDWSEPIFAFLVLFFAFATVICWAHYGQSALSYLTERKGFLNLFVFLYAAASFFGTNAAPGTVFTLADLALGLMTIVNLCVLILMRREIKAETVYFLSDAKKNFKKASPEPKTKKQTAKRKGLPK